MMKTSKTLFLVPNKFPRGLANIRFPYNQLYPQIKFHIPSLPVYHYASDSNAKLIIEGGLLKFSAPSTFNDPFDMAKELIDFEPTVKGLKYWLKTFHPNIPNEERKRLITNLKLVGLKNFPAQGLVGFEKMTDTFGVCCFSEEPDISLMWSHYSNKHKGVALGFDFSFINEINNSFITLRKVQYKAKIEPINYFSRTQEAIEYWLESKSDIWSYEKEVRAVIDDRFDCDLFPFEKDCLKEIYFGSRMTQHDIEEILDLLVKHSYSPLIKKKMVIDKATFGLKAIDL